MEFIISRDGITLDCDGHTVTGPGHGAGLPGVELSGRRNVTVRNCDLQQFNDAFRVLQSHRNTFADNRMAHLRQGFTLQGSNENRLIRNNVIDANDFFAFAIDGNDNRLVDNVARKIDGIGIVVTRGMRNVIADNTVTDSGIAFGTHHDGVAGNTFSRNSSVDNWKAFEDQTDGFSGDGGTDNRYDANTCRGTGAGGWWPQQACE